MIAIVTCYFNPKKYKTRLDNYWIFRKKLTSAGRNLFTIELSYGDEPCDIADAMKIKTSKDNVLWSKENLLNLLVDALPKEYDKIAWLDCDIVFENYNSIKLADELLNHKKLVQLYDKVIKLPHKDSEQTEAKYYTSCCKLLSENSDELGECGFAWAAHRDFFPLYDKCIVGGGDSIIFNATIKNNEWIKEKINLSESHRSDIEEFFESRTLEKKDIGYVPGVIFHINHGTEENRNYSNRHNILYMNDYNPQNDTRYNGGLLEFSDKCSPAIKKYINQYFDNRLEDITNTFDGKISVAIMSWKRPHNIEKIVSQYREYNIVDDIVVFNNNPEFQINIKDKKTKCINSNFDYGLMSRFYNALFCKNQTIILHDDDLIVKESTFIKMAVKLQEGPNKLVSLHGRIVSPDNFYDDNNSYGEVPLVLTRCAAISRESIYSILDEHVDNFNKLWPSAEDFPADDAFISYAITDNYDVLPLAISDEVTELSDEAPMHKREKVRENRIKSIKQIKRWFNIDVPKKPWWKNEELTYKFNDRIVNTLCPTIGKKCGVGNFAENMRLSINEHFVSIADNISYEENDVCLIQHEHGIFNKDVLIATLKNIKGKKILFAHSPGVECFEDYVDGFACMCPGMIKTKKPLYVMPHPGYYEPMKYSIKTGKVTVGTNGFINPNRRLSKIITELMEGPVSDIIDIHLPLSMHENHYKHDTYINEYNQLVRLADKYKNITLSTKFRTQAELFQELSKIDIAWCWTDTESKPYGSGTASDLWCAARSLVVVNKEQHSSVFGLPDVTVTRENFEEFMTDLETEILDCYSYIRHGFTNENKAILSLDNCIKGFLNWIITL